MKAVPKIELCAGHKVKIKGLQKYIKYKNGTLAKKDEVKLYNNDLKTDFYLGKHFYVTIL